MDAAKEGGGAMLAAGSRSASKERNRKGVIIEVRLEQTGGKLVDRFAVTSSVGDLKTL